jgi:hypothetical protein
MTSYQSDQFFSRRPTGESLYDQSRGRLNAPFIYPDNTIRVSDSDGNYDTRVLQKGYIRRLNEFDVDDQNPVLCQFQFNPQYINQGSQFNSGIVNPIYQPIEQLKQPIASMTNFSFRLFFDRSMELNSPSDSTLVASDNPWEAGGPSQVGVLHDISALFRVIGQGISADDLENAIVRSRENLAAGYSTLDEIDQTVEQIDTYNKAVSNSSSFFSNNANVGNTAFILPYPVRIVFSSLYIVEGFVTSTALEILKFNHAYVPMQAQVTLAVNALYLGFAKKNTYFTHVLKTSAEEERNRRLSIQENVRSVEATIRQNLNGLNVKLYPGTFDQSNEPNTGSTGVATFDKLFNDAEVVAPEGRSPLDSFYVNASPTDWQRPPATVTVTPIENPARATFTPGGGIPLTPPEEDDETTTEPTDPISALFESGQVTFLEVKWRLTILGPYTGEPSFLRSFFSTGAPSDVSDILNDPFFNNNGVRKVQSPYQTMSTSTGEGWRGMSVRNLTGSIKLPISSGNTGVGSGDTRPDTRYRSSIPVLDNEWLLLFEASAKVSIAVSGTQETFTTTGYSFVQLQRNSAASIAQRVPLTWANLLTSSNNDTVPSTTTTTNDNPGDVAPTVTFDPFTNPFQG